MAAPVALTTPVRVWGPRLVHRASRTPGFGWGGVGGWGARRAPTQPHCYYWEYNSGEQGHWGQVWCRGCRGCRDAPPPPLPPTQPHPALLTPVSCHANSGVLPPPPQKRGPWPGEGGGVPMSHVEFKNGQCPLSLHWQCPMSPLNSCRLSNLRTTPCRVTNFFSHVTKLYVACRF